jgi:hypothetical protein
MAKETVSPHIPQPGEPARQPEPLPRPDEVPIQDPPNPPNDRPLIDPVPPDKESAADVASFRTRRLPNNKTMRTDNYGFAVRIPLAGFGLNNGVTGAAASLANRSARNLAVFNRVASS